ncbi:hypothetical protein CHS0354_033483 [Potamilus streckersoni]|uniref:Uncharacterized protein n=1 Tax=Potamilus streckersoni TaxID=2493646 RepID=A0AAE0T593_9BIVA|nr:hypothetical protein CHS0354_033483 [Potamilus streckersoni]
MIDFRINNTRQRDITGVLLKKNHARFITGGKADGTSKWGQGDLDLMFIYRSAIVTDGQTELFSHRHTVLHADLARDPSWIYTAAKNLSVVLYLSSFVFVQSRNLKATLFECHSKKQFKATSGPAHQMLSYGIPRDVVYAFPQPKRRAQASQWANRCRRHGWPPETVLSAIVKCGCQVVLNGFKGMKQIHIRQTPGLRQRIINYWNGIELVNTISHYCQDYLDMDQPERHIHHVLSLLQSPDIARHKSVTKCVSQMMKATLAYINIGTIKKMGISN